jgi:addiction module HigA family antidote
MRASKSDKEPGVGHPGLLLGRDVLPGLGLSVKQAAVDLGITRQTLHRILAGTAAITPGMAIRLERLTGISAALWVSLQAHHDLRLAETEYASKVMRNRRRSLFNCDPVAGADGQGESGPQGPAFRNRHR